MRVEDINLNQFYKSVTQLKLDDRYEGIITTPTSALGELRKELLETIGEERTKGFLRRYGWHCGVSDALKMKEVNWDDLNEFLLAGPKMHILHGYYEEIETLFQKVYYQNKTLHWEAYWKNSYESREHVKLFGISDHPVCHTLVGYASGYLSTILGETVIVQEVQCKGMGHDHCHCVCKTMKEWDGQIDRELKYFRSNSLINELDQTYEKLKIERDNLNKAYQVHERLMKEILKENGLSSIANVLHEVTQLPVFIEVATHNLIVVAGRFEDEKDHRKNIELKNVCKTECYVFSNGMKILITPIYLHQRIVGYCSFLYDKETPQELDKMILERAALACSLYLMNEHTRLNTEQRIRGSLLEDMLSGRICTEEMTKRAFYLGFELYPPYFMIALHALTEKSSLKEELEVNDNIISHLYSYFKDRKINALLGQKSGVIIILLSEENLMRINLNKESVCKKIMDQLLIKYPEYFIKFGISSCLYSIEDVAQLYEESLAALKVTNRLRNIVYFDSLGIEGIILQMKNPNVIQKFVSKRLGKLIEEDRSKNMELTKTLFHYINNGCNVNKTARVMNFSISGLRYRLQRLSEILKTDINRPNVSYQLFLALHSLILLGELDIDIEIERDEDEINIDV